MSRVRFAGNPAKRQKTNAPRSLETIISMARRCESYFPTHFNCLLQDRSLATAVFDALTMDERVKLVTFTPFANEVPNLLVRALESKAIEPGFFEWMLTQLAPVSRKDIIEKNKIPSIPNALFHQKLNFIINQLPYERRYPALQRITEGWARPGLHALVKHPYEFTNCLRQVPGGAQVNALLQLDNVGSPVVLSAFDHSWNITALFQIVSRVNLMTVLLAPVVFGEPVFSVLLRVGIEASRFYENISSNELLSLLSASHPKGGHSLLNEFTMSVIEEEGGKKVNTIQNLLGKLSYQQRVQLLSQPDGRGQTFVELIRKSGCEQLYEVLEFYFSIAEELKRIILTYSVRVLDFDLFAIEVRSHKDMKNALLSVELKNELAYFQYMISDKEDLTLFVDRFNQRCAYRSLIVLPDDVIPVHLMPETPVNRMYFEFMLVLYNPKNLAEVIPILLPHFSQLIQARQMMFEVSEQFPAGLKPQERMRFFKNKDPQVVLREGYPGLRGQPPTMKALSDCVFTSQCVIDLNDINQYGFKVHSRLFDYLQREWPGNAGDLYYHNLAWLRLASDIQVMKKVGFTPKEAIEALVSGLLRGGERITSKEANAGAPSMVAVSDFVSYFEALPQESQRVLKQLTDAQGLPVLLKFFDIIFSYGCVEGLADSLCDYLRFNANHPLLNTLAGVSPSYMKTLERQCRNGLDTRKASDMFTHTIPAKLSPIVVAKMDLSRLHEDIYKISFIPNEFMSAFWRHVVFVDEAAVFTLLSEPYAFMLFTARKMLSVVQGVVQNLEHRLRPLADAFLASIMQYCLQNNDDFSRVFLDGVGGLLFSNDVSGQQFIDCLQVRLSEDEWSRLNDHLVRRGYHHFSEYGEVNDQGVRSIRL